MSAPVQTIIAKNTTPFQTAHPQNGTLRGRPIINCTSVSMASALLISSIALFYLPFDNIPIDSTLILKATLGAYGCIGIVLLLRTICGVDEGC